MARAWIALIVLALGVWCAPAPASAQAPATQCPGVPADCPTVTGTAKEGQFLSATTGAWSGAGPIQFTYQWQSCSSAAPDSCVDIGVGNGQEATYLVTESDGSLGRRFRVRVTASNGSGSDARESALTAPAITAVGIAGDDATTTPSITVLAPGDPSAPEVGDTLHQSGATFDPAATLGTTVQWRRCTGPLLGSCVSIPGATGDDYILVAADGGHAIRVRVTGRNVAGSRALHSSGTTIIPVPPAPPPPPPGLLPPGPPPGPGGDVIVDTFAPVISRLSVSNRRFALARTPTPTSAAQRRRSAPRGTAFRFTLSEPASVTIAIRRLIPGRRISGKCRPASRRLRRRPKCTRERPILTLTRSNLAEEATVPFTGRWDRRKLPPGRYRAVVVATDTAANRSQPATVGFTVVPR